MNTYTFELEYKDDFIEEIVFSAANLMMATEMLDEYLKECCVDKKDIRVIHVGVNEYEEEEDYDD